MSFEWWDYFIACAEPEPEPEPESEPTRYCRICRAQKYRHQFPSNSQFKQCGVCIACDRKLRCVYCGTAGRMTKEHVLPKSAGGTVVVAACQPCNGNRGRSGSYRPFVAYITANPTVWVDALKTAYSIEHAIAYITEENLVTITLHALLERVQNDQ